MFAVSDRLIYYSAELKQYSTDVAIALLLYLTMADAASQLYEEEFDEGQADDLRAELAAVERAEARLLDGTYGRSIESGVDIPDERLEAVPTAERTAEEQARFERG